MSANIVSDQHINALLNFANRHRNAVHVRMSDGSYLSFDQSADLQHAAEMLSNQNTASYNTRYETEQPAISIYWNPRLKSYTAVEILKACDGYDYQACETEGYFESDTAKIVNAIRRTAIHDLPGYEAATTWGIA